MRKNTPPHVLVVDDDPFVLRPVQRILQAAGYQTRKASSGAEALAIDAEHGPFDLLLTDFVMPDMSGDELAYRVRRRHPHTKVIYLTGYTDRLFTDAKPVDQNAIVLEKPATSEAVLEGVSMTLFGHPHGLR